MNTTLKTLGHLCRALRCEPGDLFTIAKRLPGLDTADSHLMRFRTNCG
jgi:hypothetical protein